MNRLLAMVAVSGFATVLFVVSFLVNGIESPLTWATIAVWVVADTALVATMVGQTRATQDARRPAAQRRGPAERRAAAQLSGALGSVIAERSADGPPGTSVVLLENGRNKIAVIKALKDELKTGLRQAKELADSADGGPAIVATGLGPADAERLLRELHAAGARAEIC